ncbi:hypothetical protein E2C01_051852 [Portunus trituberculatus]|uniref:Uncharacterized protein n=1 Tax=Portunus trituberculatus TaxID=210409 RepID=A0A5B7GK63_PORTR|nr:hypothetical protein [Portunus trituberculatus]
MIILKAKRANTGNSAVPMLRRITSSRTALQALPGSAAKSATNNTLTSLVCYTQQFNVIQVIYNILKGLINLE